MTKEFNLKNLEKKLLQGDPDLKKLSANEQFNLITEDTESVIEKKELLNKLTESKRTGHPLKIKLGVDATGPDIHLGHAIPLILLNRFQKMGHEVYFIIGDFTTAIGDPSGRVTARPVLSEKEIAKNIRLYKKQAAKLLDVSKAKIYRNSEWLNAMTVKQLFSYLKLQTVSSAFQREDFRKRKTITRAELLYATIQAIDSVHIKADIEIGGKDQLLNFMEGRELMSRLNMVPQSVITLPLLPGINGGQAKMSKSLKNYIGVLESAPEIYGKVMSIPDQDMLVFFKLLTTITNQDLKKLEQALKQNIIHPKEVKKLLARQICQLVGQEKQSITKAEILFEKTYAKKQLPKDLPIIQIKKSKKISLVELLILGQLVTSKSESKRLIKAGSVHLLENGKRIAISQISPKMLAAPGFSLQVGKRRFIRIKWI